METAEALAIAVTHQSVGTQSFKNFPHGCSPVFAPAMIGATMRAAPSTMSSGGCQRCPSAGAMQFRKRWAAEHTAPPASFRRRDRTQRRDSRSGLNPRAPKGAARFQPPATSFAEGAQILATRRSAVRPPGNLGRLIGFAARKREDPPPIMHAPPPLMDPTPPLMDAPARNGDGAFTLNPEIGTTDFTDDTDFKALGAKILLTHWVRWREAGRHSEISESV